jgi:hypothetical protein
MRIPAFLLSILILRGFILAETPSPRPNGDADSHTTYIAKNFKVAVSTSRHPLCPNSKIQSHRELSSEG